LEIPVLAPDDLTNAARFGCERHLAASDASLVVFDLEELLGETEPQNRPGTGEGNWRQRSALTLEAVERDAALNASLERFNDVRTLSSS
jgi:4-alpha-glucanotransferase